MLLRVTVHLELAFKELVVFCQLLLDQTLQIEEFLPILNLDFGTNLRSLLFGRKVFEGLSLPPLLIFELSVQTFYFGLIMKVFLVQIEDLLLKFCELRSKTKVFVQELLSELVFPL